MIDFAELEVLRPSITPGGWVWSPIHYSMDPECQSPDWYAKAVAQYPRPEDFARENEIDFGLHVGAPAYPFYRETIHVVKDLPYLDAVPLCLCLDFNVSPMVWEVAQIVHGNVFVIDELYADPATIDGMVQDFRNRYGTHKAPIIVYGDATGIGRSPQTAMSHWQLVRLGFRGFPAPVEFRVGVSNPDERDRLASVNRLMQAADGGRVLRVAAKCVELVQDFRECVLDPKMKKLRKVYDIDDPYHLRTHASDALGYFVFREFGVSREAAKLTKRKPKPMKPKRDFGVRWDLRKPRKK